LSLVLGLKTFCEQGKGHLIQDALGFDGHDAMLEFAQVPNVLMGDIIGAVA
jgi:hypothetical protein